MIPDPILNIVCRALDTLVEIGRRYAGLFPSLLDISTYQIPMDLPPAIEGQRNGDRSHPGSNLIHDEATLATLYALSEALDRRDYGVAADRYLRRFAVHCTITETGLFPWGEHAFWHLDEDRVGNSRTDVADPNAPLSSAIHDHLRQAPVWLWEKLYSFNPACVERFAEGLEYHWTHGERLEYIRHARIEERSYLPQGDRSCDFPRHSGFYILDWAFAYKKTGREAFLSQIERIMDYWWEKRDDRGLLLIESRSPEHDPRFHNVNAPGQTLSLAASLLESAQLLDEHTPEIAERMRNRAATYIDGFLSAPHDLENGVFVLSCHRDTDEILSSMPVWGSRYGIWPASYVALTCLCAYRLTGNDRLLRWAEAVGQKYTSRVFPPRVAVPAMDAGLGVELLADLYDLTDDTLWLDNGLALAKILLVRYMDYVLPRGASGITWYESQMGPGFLLHGLSRIALFALYGRPCLLSTDYTAR